MTADQCRTAILEFARGRLPEGARIEDPDHPGGYRILLPDGIALMVNHHAGMMWVLIAHGPGTTGSELTRKYARSLTSAANLAEAIEAFARGLTGEE